MKDLELTIKNNYNEHQARFEQISKRGMEGGISKVSPELKTAMIKVAAGLLSYMKTAALADELMKIGGPDHIPDEIDNQMTKSLNDFDDIMTLELSALV